MTMKPTNVALTDEEKGVIIGAIHLAMDMYVQGANDLSDSTSPEDQVHSRDIEVILDLLDKARRKLGDTWEPAPEYRVPDSPEGL
jgi:hypothetical protein